MTDIEETFSEKSNREILETIKKELEDLSRRVGRLEHKVYNFKAVPSGDST